MACCTKWGDSDESFAFALLKKLNRPMISKMIVSLKDIIRMVRKEIGSRATIFELEGLGSEKKKYVKWLLVQSVVPKTKIESVITDDAVAMLSEKLSTPLQFEYYLTRALEEAYKVGQKPVGADMIENVLAKDINGLEPRLTRQGYNAKVLAELLNAKPREIRSFLSGQLASGRAQELQSELLAAGIDDDWSALPFRRVEFIKQSKQ